jgi:hypothetical protein
MANQPDTIGGQSFRPFPEQNERGVDRTIVRELLKLTPTERVRRAEQMRLAALRLQEYGRKHRANKPA